MEKVRYYFFHLMKKVRFPFLILFFLFLWIELCCFGLIRIGFIKTLTVPSYSLGNVYSKFWADINPDFGRWHVPNSTYVHKTRCYKAFYKANSYGARDKERTLASSSERVILLGDSLIEGFGVETGDRLSDWLEASTGIEHLNFGCAGFGTTQYALIYEKMASKFSHNSVIVGLSPANDFHDDDIEYGKIIFGDWYRPYYTGKYPQYKITYYKPTLDSALKMSCVSWIKGILREFTYSYTVLSHYSTRITYKKVKPTNAIVYSGYYDFNEEEYLRAKYSIEQIVRLSKQRNVKVYVFTIPKYTDFIRYKENGESPLSRLLVQLSKDMGFEYFDLLPLMYNRKEKWNEYFYTCDSHMNKYGNQVASQFIKEKFSMYR